MIGTYCRSLRLHWIAVLGIALALSPVVRAVSLPATTTTLAAQSSTQPCPSSEGLTTTLTTLTVSVTGSGSVPQGTINITDQTSPAGPIEQIASATLDASGQAIVSLYLAEGPHLLQAAYAGNSAYAQSTSAAAPESIASQCTSSFAVTISGITPPASGSGAMVLADGEAGTAIVTVTPSQEYVASLGTSGTPAFVTVSCSGLPSLSSCTFTPQIIEILPGQDAGIASSMLIQTESPTVRAVPPPQLGPKSNPIAWAVLLPGIFGLGGLAFGARRRRWLQRLSLILLVGLVATLGATGCNPQYNYYHHGPNNQHQTPTGTFNVTVTGQSSNGVTAITNSTNLVLTVQ